MSGQTAVSGSNFRDASGVPVPVGSVISFTPCDPVTRHPIPYRGAGTQAGPRSQMAVPFTVVTAGAISITLDDTSTTDPQNLGYLVTAVDPAGHKLLGAGIVIQPRTATWSFDTDWEPDASAYALIQAGADGKSFNPRGAWAPSTSYSGPFDTYTHGGSTYRVLTDYTSGSVFGSADTTNTEVSAAAGSTGANGTNGTNGSNGTNGAPGAPGIASLPELASLRVLSGNAANLYDNTSFVSGVINVNGSIQSASDQDTSALIPANAGGQMSLGQWNGTAYVPFTTYVYDAGAGFYVSGYVLHFAADGTTLIEKTAISSGVFNCPTTAVYVRFSAQQSAADFTKVGVFVGGTFPSHLVSHTSYSSVEVDSKIATTVTTNIATTATAQFTPLMAQLRANLFPQGQNLIDPNATRTGPMTTTGALDTSKPYETSTGFFLCSDLAGGHITGDCDCGSFGMPPLAGFGNCFIMADGTIKCDAGHHYAAGTPVPVLAGSVAMAIIVDATVIQPGWTPGQAYPTFIPGSVAPTAPLPYTLRKPLPLDGQRIAIFGDSYTASYSNPSWMDAFFAKYGGNLVYLNARSGRSISMTFEDYLDDPDYTRVTGGDYTQIQPGAQGDWQTGRNVRVYSANSGTAGNTFAQDMAVARPDIIIVWLGTNFDSPAGSPGDSATTATDYGYAQRLVTAMKTTCPTAQLVLISPIQTGDSARTPSVTERTLLVLQTVGKAAGIPVFDLLHTSNIDSFNWSITLLGDLLHPAPQSRSRLGELIGQFVLNTCSTHSWTS